MDFKAFLDQILIIFLSYYYSGLFLTLLLFIQASRFIRLEFPLAWWAYSFPLAAISIASMVMFELTGSDHYRWISAILLMMLTAIVALLIVRTILAVARHRICCLIFELRQRSLTPRLAAGLASELRMGSILYGEDFRLLAAWSFNPSSCLFLLSFLKFYTVLLLLIDSYQCA